MKKSPVIIKFWFIGPRLGLMSTRTYSASYFTAVASSRYRIVPERTWRDHTYPIRNVVRCLIRDAAQPDANLKLKGCSPVGRCWRTLNSHQRITRNLKSPEARARG